MSLALQIPGRRVENGRPGGGHARATLAWDAAVPLQRTGPFVAGLILAQAFLGTSERLGAQRVVHVDDGPACQDCVIITESVATLGQPGDRVLLRANSKPAVDSRGRFFVGETFTPGVVAMFSSNGDLLRTFGRAGEGPREFHPNRPKKVAVGPADTIYVFQGSRQTRIAPGLSGLIDATPLSVPPWNGYPLGDGRVVAAYPLYGRGQRVTPLHLLDQTGEVIRTFSRTDQPVDYYNELDVALRVVAKSGDGRLWVGHRTAYRVERWDTAGDHEATLLREAEWFQPWSVAHDPREEPPSPVLFGLAEDGQGRLWTAIGVPDEHWRPHPAHTEGASAEDLAVWDAWDTMIEVLDPDEGRVIARLRFDDIDGLLFQPEGPGQVLSYANRENPATGTVSVAVERLRLQRPLNR